MATAMVYDALMRIRHNTKVPKKGISSAGIGIEPPTSGGCPHYIEVEPIRASTMKNPARRQAGRGLQGSIRLG
jgi:hypothetical protein